MLGNRRNIRPSYGKYQVSAEEQPKDDRTHDRSRKTRLKSLAKKVEALAAGDDKEALKVAAGQFVSAMDRAAKTHLVHNNKASRTKAAMAKLVAA